MLLNGKKIPGNADTPSFRKYFWTNTKDVNGCWEWQRGCHTKGYGKIEFNGKQWTTHRLAYTLTQGDIQNGLLVCHTCDNRRCVNPAHLFLGTDKDNIRDMHAKGRAVKRGCKQIVMSPKPSLGGKGKPFCINGHAYSEENTAFRKNGVRNCRICRATNVKKAL